MTSYESLLEELMGKDAINLLGILGLQCHLNEHALTRLFSLKFFQSVQLEEVKKGNEHLLVHLVTLERNYISSFNAPKLYSWVTMCLKQQLMELLQVETTVLQPSLTLWVWNSSTNNELLSVDGNRN